MHGNCPSPRPTPLPRTGPPIPSQAFQPPSPSPLLSTVARSHILLTLTHSHTHTLIKQKEMEMLKGRELPRAGRAEDPPKPAPVPNSPQVPRCPAAQLFPKQSSFAADMDGSVEDNTSLLHTIFRLPWANITLPYQVQETRLTVTSRVPT